MDEHSIRLKYSKLLEKGVKVMPLQRIMNLEKSKDKINSDYLSCISDLTENEIIFNSSKDMNDFLKDCSLYFGAVNFKDIQSGSSEIVYSFIFDFCQIRIIKNKSAIESSINIYWDL